MVQDITNRHITHVLMEVVPPAGFRRLSYYTQDSPCDVTSPYFHGMGGTADAVSRKVIDEWIEGGHIIELPNPIHLDAHDDLWLGADGHLYSGYGFAPWKNQKLLLENFLSYKK